MLHVELEKHRGTCQQGYPVQRKCRDSGVLLCAHMGLSIWRETGDIGTLLHVHMGLLHFNTVQR